MGKESGVSDPLELRIGRLELEPGDVLVVELPEGDDGKGKGQVFTHLVPPGVRVLLIPHGMSLSVLTKADLAKIEAAA